MSDMKEIKNRIKSVSDTQKITNAMYLIASTKLRKAKAALDETRPYFDSIEKEIKRIFRINMNVENQYFFPVKGSVSEDKGAAYLVITADKGLAGPYNQNVIKRFLEVYKPEINNKIFVVGEYGRHYFESHKIKYDDMFHYTAQNPTLRRAASITEKLLDVYESGNVSRLYIVYTDMKAGTNGNVNVNRLLPFHRADFTNHIPEKAIAHSFEFMPSMSDVLDHIIPSYVSGFVYSALIDSFCGEQNARMMAMDSANKNAAELMDNLDLEYNHLRQNAITQEITEISAGAKALKSKKTEKMSVGGIH